MEDNFGFRIRKEPDDEEADRLEAHRIFDKVIKGVLTDVTRIAKYVKGVNIRFHLSRFDIEFIKLLFTTENDLIKEHNNIAYFLNNAGAISHRHINNTLRRILCKGEKEENIDWKLPIVTKEGKTLQIYHHDPMTRKIAWGLQKDHTLVFAVGCFSCDGEYWWANAYEGLDLLSNNFKNKIIILRL